MALSVSISSQELCGAQGEDFVGNLRIKDIDFATVHAYPNSFAFTPAQYQYMLPNFLGDRAIVAHGIGKPIILEEFNSRFGYVPDRQAEL